MAAISIISLLSLILASPAIAHQLRRIVVSLWSELEAAKADIAAIKAAPAPTADLTDVNNKLAAIASRLDAIEASVGQPTAPAA